MALFKKLFVMMILFKLDSSGLLDEQRAYPVNKFYRKTSKQTHSLEGILFNSMAERAIFWANCVLEETVFEHL